MVKTKYEEKTRTVTDKVPVSEKRYCDICGKEITGPHWQIETGHYDWGNDSCESWDNQDVCSVECLAKVHDRYVKDSTRSDWNTQVLNINHKGSAGVRGEINYD